MARESAPACSPASAPASGRRAAEAGREARDPAGAGRAAAGFASRSDAGGKGRVCDCLVLGAGASGLAFALRLCELGRSCIVLDHAREPGRKLSLAGGGRANFTSAQLAEAAYLCRTPAFVPPVLDAFSAMGMVRLVEELGLPWEKRPGGKYFLKTEAGALVRALLSRIRQTGLAEIQLERSFGPGDVEVTARGARVQTREGGRFEARHLAVALGSPACPASGATGLGYALAQRLGHAVLAPEAALAPLLLPEGSPLLGLQGISLPARLDVEGVDGKRHSVTDDLLFTHQGISGPAVLKASLFWKRGTALALNLLPGLDASDLLGDESAGRGTPRSLLARHLPQKLCDALLPGELAKRRAAEIKKSVRREILERFTKFTFVPRGIAGLRQAEVCRGGVDCAEVEPLAFFSRLNPRVSFVGEVLDVTGLLGGFNLHWAFASGWLAAEALARRLAS